MDFHDKAKMRPIFTSEQVLIWLYLYPDASSKQSLKLALGIGVFAANLANVIVSGAYVGKFATTDLGEALYALFEAVGFFGLCYIIVIAFLSRNRTSATLQKLSDIYEQCKNLIVKMNLIFFTSLFSYSKNSLTSNEFVIFIFFNIFHL